MFRACVPPPSPIRENVRCLFTAAGLAQQLERLTAELKVKGSISWTGPILSVLKKTRNEETAFALQIALPSRGLDDRER